MNFLESSRNLNTPLTALTFLRQLAFALLLLLLFSFGLLIYLACRMFAKT